MGNPTREDIDKHRSKIEDAFVGFAISLIAINSKGEKPSNELIVYGQSLMTMMEEVATMYSLIEHPAGTFVMGVAEIETFLRMNPDQRMAFAGEMNGFLHIGAKNPIPCKMREGFEQCEMLGIDFEVLDPLDVTISDETFEKIISGASKITGDNFDVKAWFEEHVMGGWNG